MNLSDYRFFHFADSDQRRLHQLYPAPVFMGGFAVEFIDVDSGAKSLAASLDDDHSNPVVSFHIRKRLKKVRCHLGRKGIELLWTIECKGAYIIVADFHDNCLIRHWVSLIF